jgi:hypothetical protein
MTDSPLDFLDYPTAFAIQRETLDHHSRCSTQPPHGGTMWLCDCGAVVREWERRSA